MATTFEPPPTYASPILIDERTKTASFNPIWLKWFLDLVGILNAGGGGVPLHNSTGSLQGGQANQFYHMTLLQNTLMGTLRGGNGAPVAGLGNNGDFYFRNDGTQGANTVIYHKETGAWVALVTT